MIAGIHQLMAKATRSPHGFGKTVSIGIVLILCLAPGPGTPSAIGGQTNPNLSHNRRTTRALADAVTPEYASRDAEYAIMGLRSRTATPDEETDVNLPWQDELTRRLWENRILAPDPNEDAETRAALNDLIRKVRSVRFEDDTTEPTLSGPAEPAPVGRPDRATRPDTPKPTPTPSATIEPTGALAEAALKKLDRVPLDPNQVGDPLQVAELLFLSGRRDEATAFYEKALARAARNDSSTEDDRAWILFQLGNCLRQTDMVGARDIYMKLVSEYPASPWTELAKAHGRLIAWYQSAKPQQLMPQ